MAKRTKSATPAPVRTLQALRPFTCPLGVMKAGQVFTLTDHPNVGDLDAYAAKLEELKFAKPHTEE